MRLLRAAALAGAVIAGGCAAPVAREPRVAYARLAPLAALHPRYPELAALEQWGRAARSAAEGPLADMPLPVAHLFSPVSGGELAPPPVAAALERVRTVTEEEVTRLTRELTARAHEDLVRGAREAARAARAQDAQRRSEILAALADDRRRVLLERRDRVYNLRLRVANLERRGGEPNLLPGARGPAQERLRQAREELGTALEEQASRLDEVQQQYDAQLAALEQAATERVAREVEELRRRLAEELADAVAGERERLAVPVAAAAEQMTLGLELAPGPPAALLAGVLSRDLEPASGAPRQRSYSAAMAGRADELARRRNRLADLVREETRATAEALAYARNWRVKWGEPPGAGPADITERVEEWLRAYWGA
ncbi:MAG: hypothetical protein JSV65_09225 [Armatimonadota bacterium]|nr:MAG: hypothetical protein JSV65_09225 [Armatimonadota bacterium]